MTKVLIVDDQKMSREHMAGSLCAEPGYEKAGEVASAEGAVDFCRRHPVDLVLMDVCTDGEMTGFAATAKIKAERPEIRVIIVTSMLDCDFLTLARRVRADSLWYKDVPGEELMSVVRRTMAGESVFPRQSPSVTVGHAKSCEFTKTELSVLRLLVQGMTYNDIAREMGVAQVTIKKHVSSMLQKTGYTSKLRLAAEVVAKRLVVPGFDDFDL